MSTKRLTIEEVKKRVKEINPNIKIISDSYINTQTKLKIECKCGNIFEQKYRELITTSRKEGCQKCEKRKTLTRDYRKSHEQYLKEFNSIHKDKLTLIGQYDKGKNKIEYKCNICNYIGSSEAKRLISGGGCKKCGHEKSISFIRKSIDEFKLDIWNIHKDKFIIDYDSYINTSTHLNVKCTTCEHEWRSSPRNILSRGCPVCKISKGERIIKDILNSLNLNFKQQVLVEEKSPKGGTCFFDFMINDNIVIEYDGKQHFESIKYFGGNKRFENQKTVDIFKDNYCLRNNIKMVRIPYWDLDKLDKNYILKLI